MPMADPCLLPVCRGLPPSMFACFSLDWAVPRWRPVQVRDQVDRTNPRAQKIIGERTMWHLDTVSREGLAAKWVTGLLWNHQPPYFLIILLGGRVFGPDRCRANPFASSRCSSRSRLNREDRCGPVIRQTKYSRGLDLFVTLGGAAVAGAGCAGWCWWCCWCCW